MTTTLIEPVRRVGTTRLAAISVDQYHRMIEAGILPDGRPIELLGGMLVLKDRSKAGGDPMSIGEDHRWSVQQLPRVLPPARHLGYDLQTQQPVVLPPDGEPEPDGAIIVAAADEYRGRKPGAADLFCVIEVADSSLEHDGTTKYATYARAGIPQYVILNLVDRAVEVFEQPVAGEERYARHQAFKAGEAVTFWCGEGRTVVVPVESLLP